jgi:hypothetical protein
MKFVLCSQYTYDKLYARESHKYVRLEEHTDLAGYGRIGVAIHSCWMEDCNDDRIEYLEHQLVALADFGYIFLEFVDEDGWVDKYYSTVTDTQKLTTASSAPKDSTSTSIPEVLSESDRERLMEQEDGCASGACAI